MCSLPLLHLALELFHLLLQLLHLLLVEAFSELFHLLAELVHLLWVDLEILHALAQRIGLGGERAGEIRIEEWRCLGHDRIVIGSEEVFVFHGAAMLGIHLEGESSAAFCRGGW